MLDIDLRSTRDDNLVQRSSNLKDTATAVDIALMEANIVATLKL